MYRYYTRMHKNSSLNNVKIPHMDVHTLKPPSNIPFFHKQYKLTLNTYKSLFMIFHCANLKSSDTNIPVILSKTILEQVTCIKFLGVIIDNKLTFERHIVYTKNKISKGLGIITKVLEQRNFAKVIQCFCFPILN